MVRSILVRSTPRAGCAATSSARSVAGRQGSFIATILHFRRRAGAAPRSLGHHTATNGKRPRSAEVAASARAPGRTGSGGQLHHQFTRLPLVLHLRSYLNSKSLILCAPNTTSGGSAMRRMLALWTWKPGRRPNRVILVLEPLETREVPAAT